MQWIINVEYALSADYTRETCASASVSSSLDRERVRFVAINTADSDALFRIRSTFGSLEMARRKEQLSFVAAYRPRQEITLNRGDYFEPNRKTKSIVIIAEF